MTAARLLRDLLGRVVQIREAIADGDIYYAEAIAEGLETDLAGAIHRLDTEKPPNGLEGFSVRRAA